MIRLVEYKGLVNDTGGAVGHGKKVLLESIKLCQKCHIEYGVVAPLEYYNQDSSRMKLPISINVKNYSVHNILIILKNIYSVKNNLNKDDILWFTNVDWYCYLFLGISCFKNPVIVTTYLPPDKMLNSITSKKNIIWHFLSLIVKKGQEKVSAYIETFYEETEKSNAIYIPDYLYTDEYKCYHSSQKKQRVVCMGVMNNQKDLLELVKVFSQINYPLFICGYFQSEELYYELIKIKSDNITIENKTLNYEDLYTTIAESEYSISPTRMSNYEFVTSGLVRESVYLNTKVIAPQILLDNMGIKGIGYTQLIDLEKMFKEGTISTIDCENNLTYCTEEFAIAELKSLLNKIQENREQ